MAIPVEETTVDFSALEAAADRPLSSARRPFLRWAGSKRSLLKHLLPVIPKRFGTYYEPFLGSGALFFLLRPERATLADTCGELVDVYEAVRDGPEKILAYLDLWVPDKDFYYAIRENRSSGRFKRAAEFIYLNRTCWNGLYRVNAAGKFNVPYGQPKTDFIVDAENLRACSRALVSPQIDLAVGDFEDAVVDATVGDFVFLDPPYVTGHNNNGFIDYNEDLFRWSDQERLARVARELVDRGVHVVVTNADHDDVVGLYPGFGRRTFARTSTLAGNARARRAIREVVLWA